ncbi:hypothetical protein SD961_03900 [Erwinia sp. MMLR14_017]|uniref:hypothetical protein n=1 Tax=Erwinia sp. MMLR14_017 TaxID=3093842 RepID=UPI0029904A56|nr:hypothetical protein [Erwinia sp. MMLR14_017]MDW8845044.1 hypothetical protein [Erwinia sp. MMLR14_017]
MLIDSNIIYANGQTVANAIKASGKRLTTYITTNDPDYYFGLAPVRRAFPDVKIIAAPETVALINTMKKHYPSEAMAATLELGAKVAKGEMRWDHQ